MGTSSSSELKSESWLSDLRFSRSLNEFYRIRINFNKNLENKNRNKTTQIIRTLSVKIIEKIYR